uniref:Xylulose kinase-1 n=1 Tax=Tanacetum cinerariifolium TaxID=118510 RepID=A0A6L2J3V2_TANCI|nr:hypothetical protein [Tanacetum cinerariifolium]
MALTFADTHNMIAFLTKSDVSKGFEQIINFLNASVIQYALMVNPTIYVSCIKQFWSSVSLKKTNDVVRLQALIDRRKVIITEDTVRQALQLDDADNIDCLPNEEIFAELTRMGYEKPSTNLVRNVDSSSKVYMYPRFLQLMIDAQVGDLSSHTTKYTSPALYTKSFCQYEKGWGIAELDADEDATLEEVATEVAKDADVQGSLEESQAQVYHLDLEHAQKVLITAAATTITTAPMPKASAARRRKGVVIRDPEETATPSVIVHSKPKSKDKGKGIIVEEPKPLKKQAQIEHDEAYARELEAELNANINWNEVIEHVKRKEKQDNTVMRYQALKRKPQTEAQARKNMMVYLKNMAGFKMNFFKAKKHKLDEEVEELKTHLHIVPNDEDDVYTEATPLALKVPVVDYQLHTEHNKPYYKIIRADGTHQLFLSFISLLRNFGREDLKMLWKIIQERFASSEPKNFSYDFLLNTLKTMFEKPNVEAHIWKNQRGSYGLAKVKSLEVIRILWSSHHHFHNYSDDPAG